jgi:peroxiredoxin
MRKIYALLAVTAMLSLAYIGHSLAADAGSGASIGVKAPDFTLQNYDGTSFSLHDYAGKIVVLEWTNPECPIVQRVYRGKTMQTLNTKYKDQGVIWLAINSTNWATPDQNKTWAKDQGVTWPILADNSGNIGHAYGATNTPGMFIVGKDGTLLYKGGIDNDPEGDKTDGKINYVGQALDEILAGKPVSVPETKQYGCAVKYKD